MEYLNSYGGTSASGDPVCPYCNEPQIEYVLDYKNGRVVTDGDCELTNCSNCDKEFEVGFIVDITCVGQKSDTET